MKQFLTILIIVLLAFANSAKSQTAYIFSYFQKNGEDGLHLAYSEDGYKWKALKKNNSFLTPMVGGDKLMRDPCIIQGPDKKYHMVWTVSWKEKGIGYAWSEDLINWSEQKFVPVMEHEKDARNTWAPEITYDVESKSYMIYWATTIPGRFPESDNQGDSKHNHRMYYTITEDFEEFAETKLLYDQGFNVIDATIHKEGDEYIMFLKDETRKPPEKNIRVAKSSSFTSGYGKPSVPITGDYWAEGPTAIKINGEWIVYFDKYRKHAMGAVKSKDLKNWEDISDKIKFPKGTRHGTILEISTSLLEKLKMQ
jgi:hypothetical protein